MKSVKVKEVTPLTDHESTMGRGGIFKVKIAQGNGIYEATEIPVKTWDETAITTDVKVEEIVPELTTYRKLLELEKTYHRKGFKLSFDGKVVYVDWSTMIKQAMNLYGPNSYQEAKSEWLELSTSKRNKYSTNAQNSLVQLLQHKGNAELVLFTKQ